MLGNSTNLYRRLAAFVCPNADVLAPGSVQLYTLSIFLKQSRRPPPPPPNTLPGALAEHIP